MSSSKIQTEITESFKHFETEFHKDHPWAWYASLLGPFLITAMTLVAIGAWWGWPVAGKIIAAATATFFLFGRFVILLDDVGIGLSSASLFVMVTYMDVMTALFVAFHVGALFRLPWVGSRVAGLVADAQFILRMQPWMARMTFLGLVLFVVFPTSTTGSIGGSIFGRLLGLKRLQTLLAIFLGSLLGNGLMLFFSERLRPLKETFQDSTIAKVASIAILLFLIVAIERWFSYLKNKYISENAAKSERSNIDPD